MNPNPKSIKKEVVVVLIVATLLLTIAGYLVQNVVVSLQSLDMEKNDSILDISDLDKKLQEIVDKLMAKKEVVPQQPQQPVQQPTQQPAGSMAPPAALKKAEVKQVRFFEAGKDVPAPKERKYSDRFSGQARYIYTEVNYKNNNYQVQDIQIPVIIQYFNTAGKMLAEKKGMTKPKKEWAGAVYTLSCGDEQPGWWSTGQYTIKVFVDGEYVGDYSFKIE